MSREASPAPAQLLLWSAPTESAFAEATGSLRQRLQDPAVDLALLAREIHAEGSRGSHRGALVCRDAADAEAELAAEESERVRTGVCPATGRSVSFMFSGQGSQYPTMGAGLYQSEAVFRDAIDRCCETLIPHLDLDLRDLLYPAGETAESAAAELEQTRNTQPALFVIEYANARLWQSWGISPSAMIGHSVGEYAAACLAGVLTVDEALALVAARGKMMQSLPPGDMLTVPRDESDLLDDLPPDVSIATLNAPGRTVVSGPAEAIAAFQATLTGKRIRARILHTSHAFHSAMMDPILEPFTDEVRKVALRPPAIPYVSNVTGTWISDAQATDPSYYATHLRRAVRFADGTGTLLEDPERILLEVGPGNTLATLAKRHPSRGDGHVVTSSIRHPRAKEEDDRTFALETLGELWVAGVDVDGPVTG